MPTDLSKKLASFSAGLTLENVPAAAIANGKLAILDCLGVSVLAVSDDVGQMILQLAAKECWQGPCTIWGSGARAAARDAAFANATLAHALDYDDGGHVTTYILAAAIALAERGNTSGRVLLEAFIAGREVRMSLDPLFANRFAGVGPGARGWHANGILGPIAAACSAGKILNLDVAQTLNAIGLAAGSCGALGRDGGTMAKPFRAGHAAAAGVTCALLAQDGFTADTEALEGPYGLFSALAPVDEEIVNSLGQNLGVEFDLAKRAVKVKKFAAAAATHAPVEAMLRLLKKRPVSPFEVERIECDLKPYPLLRLSPQNGHEGKFSMAYCLAVALLHNRLDPEDFSDTIADKRELKGLIRAVHHRSGEKSLTVVLKSGEEITEPVQPIRDLQTWDEVVHKFHECTSRILTGAQRAAVVDRVTNLEKLPSASLLTQALQKR